MSDKPIDMFYIGLFNSYEFQVTDGINCLTKKSRLQRIFTNKKIKSIITFLQLVNNI